MSAINIPLSNDEQAVLHRIAQARHLSDAEIAAAGLREYLQYEAKQIAKIQAGIAAADRGEFATDEEVETFFAKYSEAD